ncbi:MAG TPA: hypothetical protein VKS82_15695 [Streptosporangiaceae bacterium]|nr:hypothetical protein [Streptosporangiaceae bacterium]
MRTRLLITGTGLTLALSLTVAGSALAVSHASAGKHATTTAGKHITMTSRRGFVTGHEDFTVYATSFEASFAPIYFNGEMTTAGIGYKDFASFQDQVLLPKGNGTFVIYHPGLSQTEGVKVHLNQQTCVLSIIGKGPVYFIQATGGLKGMSGKGEVFLNIHVFFRPNPTGGGCDETTLPPWGYIEIARGYLIASIPNGMTN